MPIVDLQCRYNEWKLDQSADSPRSLDLKPVEKGISHFKPQSPSPLQCIPPHHCHHPSLQAWLYSCPKQIQTQCHYIDLIYKEVKISDKNKQLLRVVMTPFSSSKDRKYTPKISRDFRRLPKIFQNSSKGQMNILGHFLKIPKNSWRFPKIAKDFQGRSKDVLIIHQQI